jgi:hypothetical protein
MVYNTLNYWVCGLCPLPGILNTRKQSVSEAESIFVLRWRERETLCWVPYKELTSITVPRLALSKESNRVGATSPHLCTETSFFRNVLFSSTFNFWRWSESRNPVTLKCQCVLTEYSSQLQHTRSFEVCGNYCVGQEIVFRSTRVHRHFRFLHSFFLTRIELVIVLCLRLKCYLLLFGDCWDKTYATEIERCTLHHFLYPNLVWITHLTNITRIWEKFSTNWGEVDRVYVVDGKARTKEATKKTKT